MVQDNDKGVDIKPDSNDAKVAKVLGGSVTDALRRISKKIAVKKASNQVTPRQYMLVSQLLMGESVYSEAYPVAKGLEATFRNLEDEHMRMARILAVKNPDARAKGEEVDIDVPTEGLMQIAMSLVKLNDEKFPLLDPPNPNDYDDVDDRAKAFSDFLEKVNERACEYRKWPGLLKRNLFLGLSIFFKELDTLYENKTLENFLKPPTDTSSEKDSVGESQDTK